MLGSLAAGEIYRADPAMLALTATAIGAWFLSLGAVTLLRWPRTPRPAPETLELGPEPPAVVNLVTRGATLSRVALPATLLDLAARRVVDIEDIGIRRFICRLRKRAAADPTPYESRLLDHLRSLAVDGIVPAEALTTGPQHQSKLWWVGFRKDVINDAQERGLTRDLFDKMVASAFGIAGLAIYLGPFQIATGGRDPNEIELSALGTADLVGFLAMLFVALYLFGSNLQRRTEQGQAVARAWLGVRDALATSPTLGDLPPSGVVVWERHLAYGAALEIAGDAVRALPLGAEDHRHAWSRYGGPWRQVRVVYPWFHPAWGRHPGWAVALGLLGVIAGLVVVKVALSVGPIQATDALDESQARVFRILQSVALLLGAGGAVWAGVVFVSGVLDLGRTREVTGEVIRLRHRVLRLSSGPRGEDDNSRKRFFVAVDDGESSKVVAWSIPESLYYGLDQGTIVRCRVSPRLGHVYEITPAHPGKS